MQAIEHLLFLDWKIGNHAMQEQSRFIQQTFRRFNSLHDYAACQRV